ncbi:photosystem II reaction center W protein, chloroplastic-like [Cynara cardunculus var. scolymus]|uniref:PSII 6.1 kDa protein n=1 Tax=Cynara cardunculus var. scolymus TaxID=59895 RepID=A0A103XNZ7_CYNCS|nr:photosystem II reaction center W protein, chloroplastic-like [Cynara cardunculus var. scolymus]KVH94336.1 Photosystem II PsbW, class 2 [Cynara cardunculus var. scolymus]
MASIFASTITTTLLPKKPSTLLGTTCKMGKVRCSVDRGTSKGISQRLVMTTVSSFVATTMVATMSSPIAMALVDERMSTEGTGLPFGLSNNLLGWILFGVFGLIWTLYFVYTGSLDEDDDSGLSL